MSGHDHCPCDLAVGDGPPTTVGEGLDDLAAYFDAMDDRLGVRPQDRTVQASLRTWADRYRNDPA